MYVWVYMLSLSLSIHSISQDEYTPHIFVNILLYLFMWHTEEMTLCYKLYTHYFTL